MGMMNYIMEIEEKRNKEIEVLCKQYAFGNLEVGAFDEMLTDLGLTQDKIWSAHDWVSEMRFEAAEIIKEEMAGREEDGE